MCHYLQGVEQTAQEEGSPHFHGRTPKGWISLEGWSGENVGCCFSPSKVSRTPAVVAVSPRKQTRSPKVSFPPPHSDIYSATGKGLYRPGYSPANPSPFGLQPRCSPAPLWMDQHHSDKWAFYFSNQLPVSRSLRCPCSLCQLQPKSHCFASGMTPWHAHPAGAHCELLWSYCPQAF